MEMKKQQLKLIINNKNEQWKCQIRSGASDF